MPIVIEGDGHGQRIVCGLFAIGGSPPTDSPPLSALLDLMRSERGGVERASTFSPTPGEEYSVCVPRGRSLGLQLRFRPDGRCGVGLVEAAGTAAAAVGSDGGHIARGDELLRIGSRDVRGSAVAECIAALGAEGAGELHLHLRRREAEGGGEGGGECAVT